MDWTDELSARVTPAAEVVPLEGTPLVITLVIAAAAVLIGPLWNVLRVAITLVHELGHAFVGVLFGRTFTGFVVNGDMSGHAVTVGRSRGIGRVATTWAGYPMPALVGAAMVLLAGSGWGAPLLTALLVLLAVAATRIRSLLTLLVMLVATASAAALWWWRDDVVQAHVLAGVGIVLIVGAWRHVVMVAGSDRADRTSDPAVLAQLTWVPRAGWIISFVVTIAAVTWFAAQVLYAGLAA